MSEEWTQEDEAALQNQSQETTQETTTQTVEQTATESQSETQPPVVEQQQQEEKMVPLAALKEERYRRQELQQQLNTLTPKVEQMSQAFKRMEEQEAAKNQPKAPDLYEDPSGNLDYRLKSIESFVEGQNKIAEQSKQWTEQQAQENQLLQQYSNAIGEYVKEVPDFANAHDYLLQQRAQQLSYMGYDQQTANQVLAAEEKAIVARALYNEESPAEAVYRVAKQFGYQPPTPEQQVVNGNQNPQASSNAAKQMSQVEQGMAAQSINSGHQANQGMSIDDITALDGEEFEKAFAAYFDNLM